MLTAFTQMLQLLVEWSVQIRGWCSYGFLVLLKLEWFSHWFWWTFDVQISSLNPWSDWNVNIFLDGLKIYLQGENVEIITYILLADKDHNNDTFFCCVVQTVNFTTNTIVGWSYFALLLWLHTMGLLWWLLLNSSAILRLCSSNFFTSGSCSFLGRHSNMKWWNSHTVNWGLTGRGTGSYPLCPWVLHFATRMHRIGLHW